jgi:hypothetical protein
MGRARIRVFTGNRTDLKNGFIHSVSTVVHHVVVMSGNEIVYSTYDLKNTDKDEFDKLFKEVFSAAGAVAGVATGHPAAALATV